jgi:hypothetical protein
LVRRNMKIPRRVPGGEPRNAPDDFVAAEDTARLADEAAAVLDGITGVEWYRQHGSAVDRAALTLCRLRRARAGLRGSPEHGDEAVRAALTAASPEAVVWLASRAISYLDETGFPEAVELWFQEELAS